MIGVYEAYQNNAQHRIRKDLENVELLLTNKSTKFLHDIYEQLRVAIISDLSELQIREFSYD